MGGPQGNQILEAVGFGGPNEWRIAGPRYVRRPAPIARSAITSSAIYRRHSRGNGGRRLAEPARGRRPAMLQNAECRSCKGCIAQIRARNIRFTKGKRAIVARSGGLP
jgi:hypothetical protein